MLLSEIKKKKEPIITWFLNPDDKNKIIYLSKIKELNGKYNVNLYFSYMKSYNSIDDIIKYYPELHFLKKGKKPTKNDIKESSIYIKKYNNYKIIKNYKPYNF